ncbi:MAG: hypothetical protein HXY20_05510 [Acidobacteria bacterium]|nr:hypothetical protein [Acidobacteriota bacterium]
MEVRTDGGFAPGKPRLLFEKPGYVRGDPIRGWDISLDDQRFLMVKMEERKPQPVTEMIVVQNWFEELERLAPAGKHRVRLNPDTSSRSLPQEGVLPTLLHLLDCQAGRPAKNSLLVSGSQSKKTGHAAIGDRSGQDADTNGDRRPIRQLISLLLMEQIRFPNVLHSCRGRNTMEP